MVFKKKLTVQEGDLDNLDHVNNVRYVQWIQDISKEHWQTLAPKQMQKGIVWVVLNHNITYRSAAQLGDVLRIETHISDSEGATSHRIVEMFNDKTDQLLVHAVTKWCLINSETQKPMRISAEIKKVFDKGKAKNWKDLHSVESIFLYIVHLQPIVDQNHTFSMVNLQSLPI